MHKQIAGLKDQLSTINYQLSEVTKLESEAPQAAPGAPFPVVMSATVVAMCLSQARSLLENAAALLKTEIDYYEGFDTQLAALQAKGDDETAKADIEKLSKEAAAREPVTAGRAAYCMQAGAAVQIFMFKGMEKARSYRA